MAPSTIPRILVALVLVAACNSGAAKSQTGPQPEPQPSATAAATPPVATTEPKPDDDPHYLLALEFEAAGRFVEARNEVELALAAGAGRDAKLLAAKLAILRDDLDAALRLLEPLAADGKDALVLYNLGLIAQRRGEYNNARTRYIAALKADPGYAASRYNLAVLTWDAGAKQEAQHHAQKFFELAPNDPRAPELRRQLGLEITPEAPAADPGSKPATPKPGEGGDLVDPFAKPSGAARDGKQKPAESRDLVNPFVKR
ncbi:hypothetical protein [Nannocystis sp.]|uniref:tetratricopeptide repeat protein n=1 Tax=Nannocystis sp. TaxID=1962667 RepID=UPI0025D22944|nr:hypothetical protein [Nannocystis sp.]MBK7827591.1 hypothetical protein [Nannocystis sp.]